MDIEEIKKVFASNLISLRKSSSLTQAELADKLNYSDKAISKWERAEAIPDVYMLKTIADMFNVSIDYLLSTHNEDEIVETKLIDTQELKMRRLNHILISSISILGVWVIATILFVIWLTIPYTNAWMMFIYPIPISFLLAFIFSCIWGRRLYRLISLSCFGWSVLFLIFMLFLVYTNIPNGWLVFLIGIPMEVIMLLSFGIDKVHSKRKDLKNKVSE